MANGVKVICAVFTTIAVITFVVIFTILVYNYFTEEPKSYKSEQYAHRDPDTTNYENGCAFRYLIGNGICDDESNVRECNFDGGDCCGSAIIRKFCKFCECHNNEQMVQTTETILTVETVEDVTTTTTGKV